MALRHQVRTLQRRVSQPIQRDIMMQALKIAVALGELNVANVLSPLSPMKSVYHCACVSVFLLMCVACVLILRGCDLPGAEAHLALWDLWVYSSVEWIVAHPRLGLCLLVLLNSMPWLIVLVLCHCRAKQVKVTLKGTVSTVVDEATVTQVLEPSAAETRANDDSASTGSDGRACSSTDMPDAVRSHVNQWLYDNVGPTASASSGSRENADRGVPSR